MTDARPHSEPPDTSLETDRLFGRVLDGEAGPADLDQMRRLLADDATAWNSFHQLYGNHQSLLSATRALVQAADSVKLPLPNEESAPPQPFVLDGADRNTRWSTWAGASGWVAAIVLFSFLLIIPRGGTPPAQSILKAEYTSHLEEVRPAGRELDPVVLNVQQRPDGRWEVTVIRRPVEVFLLSEWQEQWVDADVANHRQ